MKKLIPKDGFCEWLYTNCYMARYAPSKTAAEAAANTARYHAFLQVIEELNLMNEYQNFCYECLIQ